MAERKSRTEIVLMPLAVAIVGIVGTFLITNQQEKNARTLSNAQIECTVEMAEADRQVKILEIFAEKITSTDEPERLLALRMLRSVDGELAQMLATAVVEGEPVESEVRKVADKIAEEGAARASLQPRIYIHIRAESDRAAARTVGNVLKEHGYVVPGIERLVNIGPNSSQLRYFREAEEERALEIRDDLAKLGVPVELRYIKGYEESDKIRENHFELWFAEGQPGNLES